MERNTNKKGELTASLSKLGLLLGGYLKCLVVSSMADASSSCRQEFVSGWSSGEWNLRLSKSIMADSWRPPEQKTDSYSE